MGRRPGLLGRARIQDLLARAIRLSEADETELVLSTSVEALTRFAHNVIHQNVAETDACLEVRAAIGRRVGQASTNNLSPSGIEQVVQEACAVARHLPEISEWPGLPDPAALPATPTPVLAFDEAIAEVSPHERARVAADICHAAAAASGGLLASGAFSTAQGEQAVMNSRDLFAYAEGTTVDLTFVVEQPGDSASAFAHSTGWRLDQIDVEALKSEALDQAQAGRRPRQAPVGEFPVVLEPYAVVTLLEALAVGGMGALAVQEGRSWMNRLMGRRCLSTQLSITDDALDPDGLPQAFDCEGVPKQRVSIVVDGVPVSPVYDRLTAAREAGKTSTGHAQPYDDEDWDGPLPENLSVTPGDMTVKDMIRATDRGLYVTRFWYVNVTRPRDCGVTGTTRDGVWWIERGELAYPVTNLRFDQGLISALRGVRGVGRERRTLSGFFGGVHRVPALALEGFRFIEP